MPYWILGDRVQAYLSFLVVGRQPGLKGLERFLAPLRGLSQEVMMEISNLNIPMPALPDATREPPRDAEVSTAVRETQATEPENNDARSSSGGDRDDHSAPSSTPSLGSYVDETV